MTTRAPAVLNINSNVTARTLFRLKKKSKCIASASRVNDTKSAMEEMDLVTWRNSLNSVCPYSLNQNTFVVLYVFDLLQVASA